jgi:hypothetical protein
MFAGYQLGVSVVGQEQAEETREAQSAAWDDGYCSGVQDARVDPEMADDVIREIIAEANAAEEAAWDAMDADEGLHDEY